MERLTLIIQNETGLHARITWRDNHETIRYFYIS